MLDHLDPSEIETVRSALEAAARGPFFPDWEFQTLFGVDRDAVERALQRFPALEGADDRLAVNNAFANLLGYPHGGSLDAYNLTGERLHAVFDKWRTQ